MEEGHPFGLGAAWRTLVGNEAQYGLLSIAHHSDDGAQRLLLGYAYGVESATQAVYQLVHHLVAERVVYLSGRHSGVYPHGDGDDVFPVGLMPEVQEDGASITTQLFDVFRVGESHAAAHLLVGDMHQLHRFHYIVAEVTVEFLLYLFDLLLRLFGERMGKVLAHHLTSVPHDVVYKRIDEVAQYIEYPQRPYGYGFEYECEQGKLNFIYHQVYLLFDNLRFTIYLLFSNCVIYSASA